MDKKTCADCKHYRQHYVKCGSHYFRPISDGHCVRPRLKLRKAESPACEKFSPRGDNT